MEAAYELGYFLLEPTPIEYMKEQIGTIEYYNNRVRTQADLPTGKQWAQSLTVYFKGVAELVESHYKNVKVAWKGSTPFAAKLEAGATPAPAKKEEPKKEEPKKAAASKPATAAKKDPVKKFDAARKMHIFENIVDENIEITSEGQHSVQIFNCKGLNLNIHGKVNMI